MCKPGIMKSLKKMPKLIKISYIVVNIRHRKKDWNSFFDKFKAFQGMNQDNIGEQSDEFDYKNFIANNNSYPGNPVPISDQPSTEENDSLNDDSQEIELYPENLGKNSVSQETEIISPYTQTVGKLSSFLTPAQVALLPDGEEPLPLGSGLIAGTLGEGGMARVYRIWNQKLELYRAVKVVYPTKNPELMERFETEVKIGQAVN